MKQLQFFETRDISKEFDLMKKEWEKTRRSLYARQAELVKNIRELEHEYDILKLGICKGKILP